jgi:hypothetical protein
VAAYNGKTHPHDLLWANVIQTKLGSLGIHGTSDFLLKAPSLNGMLRKRNMKELHQETIVQIVNECFNHFDEIMTKMEEKIGRLNADQISLVAQIQDLRVERRALLRRFGMIPPNPDEMVLPTQNIISSSKKKNVWLADSGASTHMRMDDKGMSNVQHI